MTLILEQRDDITLDAVYRVAWQGEPVALHEAALARMKTCREAFMRLIDSDENIVIYGVTSGYGQMANLRFTLEERRQHAKRPPDAAASSFGEPLPVLSDWSGSASSMRVASSLALSDRSVFSAKAPRSRSCQASAL